MPYANDIFYQISAKGAERAPALVLIHGAGGNHLHWPAEARRMAGRRVLALDLPGHGQSRGEGMPTIAGYAERVLGWLAALGIERAVFAGHSMGSAIALTLALAAPQRVIALALVGAGARLRVSPQILELAADAQKAEEMNALLVQWNYASAAAPELLALARQRMNDIRPGVMKNDLLACNQFDVVARLGEIRQPALVLCGAEDAMTPPRYTQFLANALPQAQMAIIPGAGHMVMLEQPAAVTAAIQGFLSSLNVTE